MNKLSQKNISVTLLLDFLTKTLGSKCEIVVHDFTNIHAVPPEGTIVFISNSFISGRKIGDALLPSEQTIMTSKPYLFGRSMTNYEITTPDGRQLLSSALFITDDNTDDPTGMISINRLLNPTNEKKRSKSDKSAYKPQKNDQMELNQLFIPPSIQEVIESIICEELKSPGADPGRLSPKERAAVVSSLQDKGIFQLRTAVTDVAQVLKISEPTIYRYLQKSAADIITQ